MAESVTRVLEKHEIPYMITLGTLLGAIRHGGFIPWDTDFDLHMFDETYDDGIEVLRENLPESLFLEDERSEPLYFHGWAHVKDTKSELINERYPQDNVYSHHGLSLDLYRLHKTMKKDVMDYINSENKKYILRRYNKG